MGLVTGIGYGRRRQADIYVAGVRGLKPRVPQSAAALEREAERAMSTEGFAYIAGGAGSRRRVTTSVRLRKWRERSRPRW